MVFKFSAEIYSKTAMLKATYHFTDMAYLHLDMVDGYYVVDIVAKDDYIIDENELKNEMLAQMVREMIFFQTKDIREISLARALASSAIEEERNQELVSSNSVEINDILKDWFELNE